MVSEDHRGNKSAEDALSAAEQARARQAGAARRLVSWLGLGLVALGAYLVRLGLPSRQPVEK
jgi:hypothetical protein